jgi:hypothetical protein
MRMDGKTKLVCEGGDEYTGVRFDGEIVGAIKGKIHKGN